jgi:hypothetical protein
MKKISAAAALLFCLGMTACGSGDNGGSVKVDTTVSPTDNTNAVQSDTTKPANAPGLDTVGGGQSTSPGIKDTTKKKE